MRRFERWQALIVVSAVLWFPLALACGSPGPDAASESAAKEPGTYWQLLDDSNLDVALEPWPPSAGSATLRAVATLGDWSEDQILAEQLSYRIAEIEDGFDPWTPMTRTAEDEDQRHFEATVALEPGTWFVQLKVEGSAYDEPLELTDWKVEVD
jgi:hypothetical protein